MVAGVIVQRFEALPSDISFLLDESLADGHNLVKRLIDDWRDGSNRFDQPGEIAMEARLDARLVAVGGLNRDPYIDDPDAGRIRHIYVSPDLRGRGVGRALVLALLDEARASFQRVRLRTNQPGSTRFYAALGFQKTDEPEATHVFWL